MFLRNPARRLREAAPARIQPRWGNDQDGQTKHPEHRVDGGGAAAGVQTSISAERRRSSEAAEQFRGCINQRVVPVQLTNLVSRTVLPIALPDDVAPGTASQTGLGDNPSELLLPTKVDRKRPDMGCRSRAAVALGYRFPAGQRISGGRSGGRSPVTVQRVDVWRTGESSLVVCGRWRPARRQCNLFPVIPDVHDEGRVDFGVNQ